MIKYAKKLQEKRKRVVAHVSVETYDNLIKLSRHKKLSVSQIINNQITNK